MLYNLAEKHDSQAPFSTKNENYCAFLALHFASDSANITANFLAPRDLWNSLHKSYELYLSRRDEYLKYIKKRWKINNKKYYAEINSEAGIVEVNFNKIIIKTDFQNIKKSTSDIKTSSKSHQNIFSQKKSTALF